MMRRRPEDEHTEVLLNVVEPVLDAGGDEDEAPRPDRANLVRDPDRTAPADDVVHLVFLVWPLAVGRSGGPDGKANAELLRGEKVDVAVTVGVSRLRIKVGDLVSLHMRR